MTTATVTATVTATAKAKVTVMATAVLCSQKNWYAYSQRKNFWDAVGEFHHMGYTTDLAIVWMYEVYGSRISVTAILDAIITDKQSNIARF
jgi:hypothetical protein